MTALLEAQAKDYLVKVPHYNSIFNYLDNPALTPIWSALIAETSKPLQAVDVDFAADSSGFATSRFARRFDHKYGVARQRQEWVKVYLTCGVSTHIVTATEIRGKDTNDMSLFPAMVDAVAQNFQMRREEFLSHYHKRSNVRSVFSMIKAKFRSKSDVSLVNEAFCKIICHNICCLIHA
jgi:hypothetical protein